MIDLEFLEKLIRTLDQSGIDHIEIERGGTRLRVSKTPSGGSVARSFEPAEGGAAPHPGAGSAPTRDGAPVARPISPGGESAPSSGSAPAAPEADGLVEITSPMVGTFYRASAPDADPFTDVGRRVHQGDPLCIIEAMKLMNELEAEISGVVREICVANGEPVEYGQVLFRVEPD